MKALVVYESMYGNTRTIAEAIATGIAERATVHLVPTMEALDALAESPDLVVVGGPTHAHGMSRVTTRQSAIAEGNKPGTTLRVHPHAHGPGVRDLLESIESLDVHAAAFDTRASMPPLLSGRAAKGIARELRRRGARLVAEPESFLVTKESRLVEGETDRARRWGAQLADQCRSDQINTVGLGLGG